MDRQPLQDNEIDLGTVIVRLTYGEAQHKRLDSLVNVITSPSKIVISRMSLLGLLLDFYMFLQYNILHSLFGSRCATG